MQFQQLDTSQQNEFDTFVAAHECGSFLQSWQWGSWQEKLRHEVLRIVIRDQQNKIVLAAQILKMVVPKFKWHYLYIPYGPLISSSVSEHDQETAQNLFLQELKKLFPQALNIRIEPNQNLNWPGVKTLRTQPGKTLRIDLTKTPEQLLAEMHPKTRYNIKVAERHGVKIITEPIITPGHGLYLEETVNLLLETAKRQNYKSHGASYYKNLIDFLSVQSQGNLKLFVYRAVLQKKLLASAIMLDFGSTCTYLFGGTSNESRNVMAPYALHWQAIQQAKTQGNTAYDFWGIETSSGKQAGFARFKLGWGGNIVEYPAAKDIVQQSLWYNLYKLFRKIYRKF